MTSILLTGGSGQLGTELQKLGDYIAPSHRDFDITQPRQMFEFLDLNKPKLIVHAAAYTNTLGADSQMPEMIACYSTNVLGTRNLVALATCPIIFISTEAAIRPYSFYIMSKFIAEQEVSQNRFGYTILRTSFRQDPFEYPQAFIDMWTLADNVETIAKMIQNYVDQRYILDDITYVGTGAKTMFDLAKRTRPGVRPCFRADVAPYLPSLEELKLV